MSDPLVWLSKNGSKHEDFHRKAVEEAHFSQEIKSAVDSNQIDSDLSVDLDEFGLISLILPMYHSNSLHNNVRTGGIIFFYSSTRGEYYSASLILGTGRDKDRSFVGSIWPYDQPAKTYLVFATQPVSVELSESEFKTLFGYDNQYSISSQKSRYFIAPSSNHQNEFERNIDSYPEFFSSIRSEYSLDYDWIDRKSQFLQQMAQDWR